MFLFTLTVQPGTLVVEYRHGTFRRVLEPGRYRRAPRATYLTVQTREQITTIAPQEVPTADGLSLRVSAALVWAVTDARRFVEVATAPFDRVYLAVQVVLRELVAETEAVEAAGVVRRDAQQVLLAAARAAADTVGVAVLDVVVKDVLVPHELRSAQAELVTARTRGQAELEKARAETAALRSLANAAKLLDDHPALAQLRLVQALPYGSTLELSVREGD